MSSNRPFPPPSSSTHPHLVFPPPNRNPLRPSAPAVQSGGSNHHSQNWVGGAGSSSPYQPSFQPRHYHLLSSRSLRPRPQKLIPSEPLMQSGCSNPRNLTRLADHPTHPSSFYPPPPPPLENLPPRPPMYYMQPLPPRPTCLPEPQRASVPVMPSIEPTERVHMEEVRRLDENKKVEKHMCHSDESEKKVVQNTKVASSQGKGIGSTSGTNTSGSRSAYKNPLKRETKFVCKMKFRNDLPEPTEQPKLYKSSNRGYDRFTKYINTSLEKQQRPELYAEPDLGIPLDLLDLSVYNPPEGVSSCLDPEDEDLLRDDDCVTPLKKDVLIKKERQRPDDRDVTWLLETPYRTSLTLPRKIQPIPTNRAPIKKRPIRNDEVEDLPGPSKESKVSAVESKETMRCSGARKSSSASKRQRVDNSSLQGTVM